MSDARTIKVSNTADLRTAIEAGYTKDEIQIVAQESTAAIAAARAEGVETGKAEGLKDGLTNGAKAERVRIEAINDLHMAGFEAERDTALKDGSTSEAFAVVQARAIKDRGITVDAIRRDSPEAAAHAAARDGKKNAASWGETIKKFGGK